MLLVRWESRHVTIFIPQKGFTCCLCRWESRHVTIFILQKGFMILHHCFLLKNTKPVSYTHLDVYKRQAQFFWSHQASSSLTVNPVYHLSLPMLPAHWPTWPSNLILDLYGPCSSGLDLLAMFSLMCLPHLDTFFSEHLPPRSSDSSNISYCYHIWFCIQSQCFLSTPPHTHQHRNPPSQVCYSLIWLFSFSFCHMSPFHTAALVFWWGFVVVSSTGFPLIILF